MDSEQGLRLEIQAAASLEGRDSGKRKTRDLMPLSSWVGLVPCSPFLLQNLLGGVASHEKFRGILKKRGLTLLDAPDSGVQVAGWCQEDLLVALQHPPLFRRWLSPVPRPPL